MDQYDCLNKAQLSFEYLHANSTTHTFLFGALAELIDNSRDANAPNLHIYTSNDPSLRGGFYLSFLDDGCGMNYDDVFNVIIFGKSTKRHTPDCNQIGQYGNGLKSGAMRIANDFILFTKKDNIGTCLFLSRTFHQEEHIDQIICPMPCFDLTTQQPVDDNVDQQIDGMYTYTYDKIKYDLEMQLIFKYSPFKTIEDLFKQFQLITSTNGTLIVLYNLKLSDNGQPELDIKTDPYDIVIESKNRQYLFDNDEDSIPLEYRSLRAYVSILYYEPHMRITIQDRRVLTKKLAYTLHKPRQYQFKSTRFKTYSEQEVKTYEQKLQSLTERIREIDSQIYDIQQKFTVATSIAERIRLRKLQISSIELRNLSNRFQNELSRKKSDMNTTKTFTFIFGFNIHNRLADGIFIYNSGRLIKMYEKLGQTNKKTLYCRGIIGIVDIPAYTLEPTHNKQSFADKKEYNYLLKNLHEYMQQYWIDVDIEHNIKEFWETYGYRDDQLDRLPSNDPEIVKRRQLAIPMIIQCDQCLKWRRLPYTNNTTPLTQTQLESWQCSDSTDLLNNSCSVSEKLEMIPEGELKSKPQVRSIENSKQRLSTTEISSTTTHPTSQILTRSSSSSKRSVPSYRCATAKPQFNKKRKRSKTYNSVSDAEEHQRSYSSNPVNMINDDYVLPPPTIGARVWAMYQGARRLGKVLSVNDKRQIFKIRFDDFPTAEFDYEFHYKSPLWSYDGVPPPPSSSSSFNENENQTLSTIAKKFKSLIKFMLPPDWELTREDISLMSYEDLSHFDINVFIQTYRDKMTKIVEQRKTNEANWRTSTQRLQTEVTQLLNVSGMSVPNECSVKDFEQHIQTYRAQIDK